MIGAEEGGATGLDEQYTDDDLSRREAEKEVALSLLRNEEGLLSECQAALTRLDQGTFGICAGCQRPIGNKRLDIFPYTRLCTRCAHRAAAE